MNVAEMESNRLLTRTDSIVKATVIDERGNMIDNSTLSIPRVEKGSYPISHDVTLHHAPLQINRHLELSDLRNLKPVLEHKILR